MAYLLGKTAYIESLSSDVQDIHWTVRDIISRVGQLNVRSWKFPDQMACNVDIDDLLDLYSCDDENDDDEERQVAHIALYELVIDRLLLLIQATAKYAASNLGSEQPESHSSGNCKDKMAGSVGIVVKQFWAHLAKMQSVIQQLQSENKSKDNRLLLLEKELGRPHTDLPVQTSANSFQSQKGNNFCHPLPKTPGTLGIIPPNQADMVFLGLASHDENHKAEASISKDTYSKACQTYETCLVPCESCEVVQRKMRESGDIVIKVCSDQGLPCSLKKFRSEVAHVEALRFNDICRWMVEQNKDVGRICKQAELLQATVDPLKKEVKACGRKVKEAEDSAKQYENKMIEVRQTHSIMYKQLEVKMKDQEKNLQETIQDESRQKSELQRTKQKLEQEMKSVKDELKEQEETLKALELEYKVLDKELKEKVKVANQAENLREEVSGLKVTLEEVKSQLNSTSEALAREKGKGRNASSHNESLQAKQEFILSRMEQLGQENEDLSQQVASLQESNVEVEDTCTKLKMEAKELRKKVKENAIVIRNLESEKNSLAESIKESQASISELEAKLEEAKERERMIVEYPDLNGPVNPDLTGTGDILIDMRNQVTANTVRMRILEEQNSTLSQSIYKLSGMQSVGDHQSVKKHLPVEPIPLWQSEQSYDPSPPRNENNSHIQSDSSQYVEKQQPQPPTVKQHAWTFESQYHQSSHAPSSTGQGKQIFPDPSQEFLVGQAHAGSAQGLSGRRPTSAKGQSQKGRPTSAKMRTINAPVNATAIGAYTQMKQALGILSGMEKNKKARPSSGKPPSGPLPPSSMRGSPSRQGSSGMEDHTSPFSCPHCDKMYLKSRDLDIHLSYCTMSNQ